MRGPNHAGFDSFDAEGLEEKLRRKDRRWLVIALSGAVLLHASTVFGLAFWTPEQVAPPGEMVVTIDLDPAIASSAVNPSASETAESAPQQAAPPEPEPTPEKPEEKIAEQKPPPPEPVPEPAKEEVVQPEPPPEPETVQENVEPPPPAEKAEVAVAPKKTEPKPAAAPKPKPAPRPPSPAQAATSATARRADVGGSGANASPSEINKYAGRVRAAIERRKRYPAAAGGASGRVFVAFTITRSGGLTNLRLSKSSGNAALDQAARAAVAGANLPPIPEHLPDTITMGAPVNFSMR